MTTTSSSPSTSGLRVKLASAGVAPTVTARVWAEKPMRTARTVRWPAATLFST
jgi:hypothetical protein